MEYTDLTDHQKNDLLRKSQDLMSSITEIWGAEKGMEIWEVIANSLGQDIKGDLFFSMLTGKYIGPIQLITINTAHYTEIVKSIRRHTGISLEAARGIYDHVRDIGPASIEVVDAAKTRFKEELYSLGCTVR